MTKQELQKKIKKIIIKKFDNECDFTSDSDMDLLFCDIEQDGLMDFTVNGRGDFGGTDYWLQTEYYSKKLQKTIIWSHDTGSFDDIEEVADFIINTTKEIRAFEKKLTI